MSQTMRGLMDSAKKLDSVAQRKISVVLGAAVADAAARPLHWVYDNAKLQSYIANVKETPEFLYESKSPFYSLPTGENSCYWDIAEVSLKFAAENTTYSHKGLCDILARDFSPGNEKGYDMDARQVYMTKRSMGQKIDGPLDGKWFQGAVIEFLNNYKEGNGRVPFGGPKIKETDGFCLNLPLVCKFADEKNMDEISNEVIQTLSSYPTSVSHGMVASEIIKKLIQDPTYNILSIKDEIKSKYPDVSKSIAGIENVVSEKMDHVKAVIYVFGSPCYNPGSFQGAIHAVVTSNSYEEAVRKTIRAGGCNCSRSFFIGAMCGAKFGLEGIPMDWIEKTIHAESVLKLAMKAYGGNAD